MTKVGHAILCRQSAGARKRSFSLLSTYHELSRENSSKKAAFNMLKKRIIKQ